MKKVRLCYIISGVKKGVSFEWIADGLDKESFEIYYILISEDNSPLKQDLEGRGFSVKVLDSSNGISRLKSIFQLISWLREIKPDIVHTHYRDANNLGIIASYLAKVKHRIHTRHNGTYNHLHYPRAVWVDKVINSLSTAIIAISENVRAILEKKENVPSTKIRLIPHGFDLNWLEKKSSEETVNLRKKRGVDKKHPVIGVVARYVGWKGHLFIIDAFKKILEKYETAMLILANSSGPEKEIIQERLSQLPPDSFQEIEFESDIPGLFSLFDIYVHTPIDPEVEAFGQTYIEALATQVPSVFTLSGIAPEFIRHQENALVVPFQDSDKIYEGIMRLISDKKLEQTIVTTGLATIQRFEIDSHIIALQAFYRSQVFGNE